MKQTQKIVPLVNRSNRHPVKKSQIIHHNPAKKSQSPQKSHHNSKTPSIPKSISQTPSLLNKRIVSPQKLKILVLSGNDLQNDQLQFLLKCTSLIKLDLSHNNLTKLHQKYQLSKITNLRVLILDMNKITHIDGLIALIGMKMLEVLSYIGNKVEQITKAQHVMVNGISTLKVVNNRLVFVEERDPNIFVNRKAQYISSIFHQWEPTEHTQKYYLKVLSLQMTYVDNMWMYHNPIVQIQRIWRAVLDQMNQKRASISVSQPGQKSRHSNTLKNDRLFVSLQPLSLLHQIFYQWKQQFIHTKQIKQEMSYQQYESNQGNVVNFEEKEYITYPIQKYYIAKRNAKIREQLQYYVAKVRQRIYMRKMAHILKRNLFLKTLAFSNQTSSFYNLSGLKQSGKLYFNRVQQHLIENFLAHIAINFNKQTQVSRSKFSVANEYVCIRLMDADTYGSKACYSSLTYLMWPSMRCLILNKKRFQYKQSNSIIKIKSLSYIKNKNKSLTASQLSKSLTIYKRLNKFIQNEYYQSMGCFQCNDQFVMQQLIRLIYYHNTKVVKLDKIIQRSQMMSLLENYTENVPIYTPKLLERTASAVKIQQQYRRYINHKKQKLNVYLQLKRNRAARLIQRFIRDRVFYHRLAFQRNLSLQLGRFNQNDLIIPQKLYQQLPNIINKNKKRIKLYKNLIIEINQKISIHHDDFAQKQVFFPSLRNLHFACQKLSSKTTLQTTDIYKLLHKNSQLLIIQCLGQKFYQFIFPSIQIAKLILSCVSLLTYRMWRSQSVLLMSKNTLHLYEQRSKVYQMYGVGYGVNSAFNDLTKTLNINVIKKYNLHTNLFGFVNHENQKMFKNSHHQIRSAKVQFYQKKYQDFPQKYETILHFIDYQAQNQQYYHQPIGSVLNIQKYLMNNEKYLQNGQLPLSNNRSSINNQTKINFISPAFSSQNLTRNDYKQSLTDNKHDKNDKLHSIVTKFQNHKQSSKKIDLSISKLYDKKLSLYVLDGPPIQSNQSTTKTQDFYKLQAQDQQIKRQKVAKFLDAQKEKKYFFKQKKQVDLSSIRQKRKQQKTMNITLKSLNQSQRVQNLRKKAQKIKQFKQRSLSKKKDQQLDFMQQGNFIMQQQMKMTMLRTKQRQIQRLKQHHKKSSQSVHSSRSKSFRSVSSKKQKKLLFDGTQMQIHLHELGNTLHHPSAAFQRIQDAYGGQTQIVNRRTYTRKRSTKTGAYIRDPSFVHGVFPEEYYPIENAKGGIFFPRV